MRGARAGNSVVDGEVLGKDWKMALEVKSTNDDIVRGLGQLVNALANGYQQGALVTSLRVAGRLRSEVFDRHGLVLFGIDSKGIVHLVYPTYTVRTSNCN